MDYTFEGKTVVISGASRGLGRALARELSNRGARLALFSTHLADLEQCRGELASPSDHLLRAVDLARPDQISAFGNEVGSLFGAIDVLVNNASILGARTPIIHYPIATWEKTIQVNLTGTFLLCRAFLPGMIERKKGSIINVSSSVGRTGRREWGAYATSKFGLEGFTQVLADEVQEYGIRVNSVNPGAMATRMRAEAFPDEDPSHLARPEDRLLVYLYLASDQSIHVTGRALDAKNFIP